MKQRGFHWSFDHFHGEERDVIHRLLRSVTNQARPPEFDPHGEWSLTYAIAGNYGPARGWNTLANKQARQPLVGELKITKSKAGGNLQRFSAHQYNRVTGEVGWALFFARNDDMATLEGQWQVAAENSCNDYQAFCARGTCELEGPHRRLRIDFPRGRCSTLSKQIPASTALTTNWALFDVLQRLVRRHGKGVALSGFALFDELQTVRPDNTIGYLDDFELEVDAQLVRLKGLYHYGRGVVPTYYWFDEQYRLMVAASSYRTLFLQDVDQPSARDDWTENFDPVACTIARNPNVDERNPRSPYQGVPPCRQGREPRRPNIVFISVDHWNWDACSALGCEYVSTPNLDRLHANGVTFTRSYSADPICGPARSSWMTGRFTSETGQVFNRAEVHRDLPDLGQILNADGYLAVHCGKWHVGGRHVSDSFHTLYVGRENPITASGGEIHDPCTTRAALAFLNAYEDTRPFFLHVAYVNPHDICEYLHNREDGTIPHGVQQGMLRETEVPPLPDNFSFDKRETLVHQVWLRGDSPVIHPRIRRAMNGWSQLQWRYYVWNYYRFVEKVDQEIGAVLDVLEHSPYKNDTLIVFSSDHGEGLARHQTYQKYSMYDESIRVPFTVACLGNGLKLRKGSVDDEHMITGVDLLPTVCDYAQARLPYVSGSSLRPLLVSGRSASWREYAYAESNYHGRMIVTRDFKYLTEYRPKAHEDFVPPGPNADALGLEQLFDLVNDPGETRNLACESRYSDVLGRHREMLLAHEGRLKRREVPPRAWAELGRIAERLKREWAEQPD